MRFGVPVEVHAAEVYTRAMFVRFSRELFKSGSFVSVPDGNGGYRVTLVEGPVLETDSGSASSTSSMQETVVTGAASVNTLNTAVCRAGT